MYTVYKVAIFLGIYIAVVTSKPVENQESFGSSAERSHPVPKSILNALQPNGNAVARQRRDASEECERFELCMLHARSRHNFFAAYELYFVNKENARLWDHHSRSMAECRRRFRACHDYR